MITDTTRITIDLIEDDRPERFTGTPAEILAAMNATAFAPCDSPEAYMARWNKFYSGVNGKTLRTESAAAFVEDMIAFGSARLVEAGNLSD